MFALVSTNHLNQDPNANNNRYSPDAGIVHKYLMLEVWLSDILQVACNQKATRTNWN
jgi:hypothetical protein